MGTSDSQSTDSSKHAVQHSRTIVLVERHLAAELELTANLEAFNAELAEVLGQSGAKGLEPERLEALNQMVARCGAESQELRQRRQALAEQINANMKDESDPISIRQFIQTCEPQQRNRLEAVRQQIVDKVTDINAGMIGTQAVFYYSFEFYRKMISGLLQCDLKESKYGADGNSARLPPGNLLRKAC